MESHFVTLGGQRFHYRASGPETAPMMLLLHGFPEYSGSWADLAAWLPDYRIIAPDQRGYGQSWAPPEVAAYATGRLVRDMVQLIDVLGKPCAVVGHDWGAAVAYGLAMSRPDLVARLVILNGVHPVPFQRALAAGGAQSAASQYIDWLRADGAEERLAADGFAKLRDLFAAHMDMSWLTGATLDSYLREWARPGCLRGMLNWYRASPLIVSRPGQPVTDLPALPHDRMRVPMPHLLIWGENDTALLPEATEGLEAFAPDLTRVAIPGADHWLHHQQPDAVARAILDWLERPEPDVTPLA